MQQLHLFDLLLLLSAGLLVGNELAVAAFVHPTFNRLPDDAHAAVAKPFAALLGRVMPFWYALVLTLLVAKTVETWKSSAPPAYLLRTAAVLWLGVVVWTIAMLAPLNSRIARWDLLALPLEWKVQRKRWDLMHRIRVIVLSLALTLIFAGIVWRP